MCDNLAVTKGSVAWVKWVQEALVTCHESAYVTKICDVRNIRQEYLSKYILTVYILYFV